MAKKLKFPDPSEVSDQNRVAWRSSADLISLANDAHTKQAKSFAPWVQKWVKAEAVSLGWNWIYFPLAYPSKTLRAGAVFVKKAFVEPPKAKKKAKKQGA